MGCSQSKDRDVLITDKNGPKAGDGLASQGEGTGGTYDTADGPMTLSMPSSEGGMRPESSQEMDVEQGHDALSSDDSPEPPPDIQRVKEPGPVLHDLLVNTATSDEGDGGYCWSQVVKMCESDPKAAAYYHPETLTTPLHVACTLIDYDGGELLQSSPDAKWGGLPARATDAIRSLVKAYPEAASRVDSRGCIPLHYALSASPDAPRPQWRQRAVIVKLLMTSDYELSVDYLSRNDVVYDDNTSGGGRTPLYHAIDCIPDDFTAAPGPTVEFIRAVHESHPATVNVRNASDGDKPLALLYRRFTRQFDLSEKFFPGDNSRPEVVDHRREYKQAAGNTWCIVDMLLRPTQEEQDDENEFVDGENDPTEVMNNVSRRVFRIVHKCVQIDTPPDLLRYIIETHSDDVQRVDEDGNLPLHYAAKSTAPQGAAAAGASTAFPAFYTKYVIDELLYKNPDGASVKDAEGNFALTLAINSGKKWIGGGVKSLHDVYPDAIHQVDLSKHPAIRAAMSFHHDNNNDVDDDELLIADAAGVHADEHADAIMLVQRPDADLVDVVSCMWANEEDAGVQMLGCLAITTKADDAYRNPSKSEEESSQEVMRMAMPSVAAVVNAMKAHPNEPSIQERACAALRALSYADGRREVSFVASGAISAAVGAMQAHVGDAIVQEEACGAIGNIVERGGSERATVVASVSGLTAIVNSLGAHPNVVGVQREACRALEILTNFHDANLPELPRGQTAPLLEGAKRRFPEECGKSADVVLARLS